VLSSTRAKSLVGVVIAAAALIGVGVPALEDDSQTEDAAIAGVLAAIESGEPRPYEEDGQTFQNREGLLPQQPIGYYSEYTVETPGSPDRGARRLVIGEGGETYYTDDHYASFTQIDPADYGQ
jgi:guanyl-specific ribonuclease Sa